MNMFFDLCSSCYSLHICICGCFKLLLGPGFVFVSLSYAHIAILSLIINGYWMFNRETPINLDQHGVMSARFVFALLFGLMSGMVTIRCCST